MRDANRGRLERLNRLSDQLHAMGSLLIFQTDCDKMIACAGEIICEMAEEIEQVASALWQEEFRGRRAEEAVSQKASGASEGKVEP